jgi:hypothetical protein
LDRSSESSPGDRLASKTPGGAANWIARWGFALLVGACILAGAYISYRVAIPDPVPNFALKSVELYRVEAGAATFLGLYLVSMAFVLALYNRGFSEIGMRGLKAQDLANRLQQQAIQGHEGSLEALRTMVDELGVFTETSIEQLEERLEAKEGDDD